MDSSLVAARLAAVRERIELARGAPGAVTVVAVTKGFGPEAIGAAVAAGLLDIGENYGQEMLAKVGAVPSGVRWHFLGELQRNKLARLAPHVHLWHGLDREAEALALARIKPGAAVLVEVRASPGPGASEQVRPGAKAEEVPALVSVARAAGLSVRGLMTLGPRGAPAPEVARHFALVARLAVDLGLSELSMGMSADFELAVGEGATIVRLGQALFGPRPARGG
ncbi:MAG: YggS family pyridoxal phosphate enzyme [Actinobacteria bacterium]|nr:YggS family pyridoxal phosphate enzyme [Actinomycetota bacterium]